MRGRWGASKPKKRGPKPKQDAEQKEREHLRRRAAPVSDRKLGMPTPLSPGHSAMCWGTRQAQSKP